MLNPVNYLKSGSNKFRDLTIAMVTWFILFPVFEDIRYGLILINIMTSLIVLFGIHAVSETKKTVIIGLILGVPWFVLSWIDILVWPLPMPLMLVFNLFLVFFLAFTAGIILRFILRAREICSDILFGAICIYFLIGGTWSTIYMLLDTIQPGSIVNNITGTVDLSDLVYFSYITLTTLGYGEIIPIAGTARSLAIIEAIAGVMYIAIIISRLVGMFMVKSMKE